LSSSSEVAAAAAAAVVFGSQMERLAESIMVLMLDLAEDWRPFRREELIDSMPLMDAASGISVQNHQLFFLLRYKKVNDGSRMVHFFLLLSN
jgi:hypothetical protein